MSEQGGWTEERRQREMAPDVRDFLKGYFRELAKGNASAIERQTRQELVQRYRDEGNTYAVRLLEDCPDFEVTFTPGIGVFLSLVGKNDSFSWSIAELLVKEP